MADVCLLGRRWDQMLHLNFSVLVSSEIQQCLGHLSIKAGIALVMVWIIIL